MILAPSSLIKKLWYFNSQVRIKDQFSEIPREHSKTMEAK